jgi:hypothetical protein
VRLLTFGRTAALLAIAACFAPDEQDGVVRCGPKPLECPPGYRCADDGLCWKGPPSDADDCTNDDGDDECKSPLGASDR